MLRLNQCLVSKRLKQLSNVMIKSKYYYSSEPPEHDFTIDSKTLTQRLKTSLAENSDKFFRTTNPELKLFGPHDLRAPLNGNIGIDSEIINPKSKELVKLIQWIRSMPRIDEDLKSIKTSNDICFDIQLLANSSENRNKRLFRILKFQNQFPREMAFRTQSANGLELSAKDLSLQVIKKFTELFPKSKTVELSEGLTVLTLSQKTINDMSGYSDEVEEERDVFFQKFCSEANNICTQLQNSGFWADFLDPYTGQPSLGDHTNETLFETDDRFIHLGFKIEDLGCCKAIYHKKWGTHVIVGTLFTTAPAESPVLRQLMTQCVEKDK